MLQEQTIGVSNPAATRNMVAAEANHRIANSLGLVAGLARQQLTRLGGRGEILTRDEVRTMLGELTGRIDAVGRLHRMLSETNSEGPIDVGSYLQQVVSEVVSSTAKPDAVILHFACQLGCRVHAERALHIGLMVIELVTNSVKHAHPAAIQGHIGIQCRRDPRAVVVTVSDDGVGLPEAFDPDDRRHSGLRLINSLAAQIGATVSFDSGSLGLRCEIVAPVAAAVADDADEAVPAAL